MLGSQQLSSLSFDQDQLFSGSQNRNVLPPSLPSLSSQNTFNRDHLFSGSQQGNDVLPPSLTSFSSQSQNSFDQDHLFSPSSLPMQLDDYKFENEERTIVEDSALFELFRTCRKEFCGKPIVFQDLRVVQKGGALKIISNCGDHIMEWVSSSLESKNLLVSKIDIALSVLTGICGASTKQVLDIFKKLNVRLAGYAKTYRLRGHFNHNVLKAYNSSIQNARSQVGVLKEARLCGDGKWDSMGFAAKHMTYFMIESQIGKIVDCMVFSKEMARSSSEMEPLACSEIFDRLEKDPNFRDSQNIPKIKVVTTGM